MIRVVGANPAMDRISTWGPIRMGEVNRATEVSVLPGGKGFNVARATVRLGCETYAYGFLGGQVGEALREMIHEAQGRGATGVIGVDLDYEVLGHGNGMLMVSSSGTAVRFED